MSSDLGGRAARGAGITIVGQIVRVGAQFLGVIILARLLTPADFGLVAMVTAVVGIGEVLRDLGLSTSAIQAKTLSKQQRDNLFWLNTALGLALSIACACAGPLLSIIYDEPRLVAIALAVSPIFVINGLATQFRASINRDMKFSALVLIDTLAPVLALGCAIVLAALTPSYWALVAQAVIAPVIALLLCLWFARWLPSWYQRSAPMRSLVSLGGTLATVQLLNYASRNVDSVLIGATGGAGVLGLYDRAMQLVSQPINQINQPAAKVALPVLASLQDDSTRFQSYLERAQTMLLYPIAAVLALVVASADTLVVTLLGEEWAQSAIFVRLLAVGALAQAANHIVYLTFTSLGRGKQLLFYSLTTRPMMILFIGVGAFWGPVGIAVGLASSLVLMWPIALIWIRKFPGVNASNLLANSLRVVAVFGIGCAASWFLGEFIQSWAGPVQIVLQGLTIVFVVAVASAAWPAVRKDVSGLIHVARLMISRRSR